VLAATALFLVALPRVAAAAGGEGAGVWDVFWHALNLLLLLGVVFYFGRRPIREFFGERRASIRENLESSARQLAAAERGLAEWEGRLERLDAEIEEVRSASQRLAEAERERILAEARAAADRIRSEAGAAVEQEVRRARKALREEAADLAVGLAEQLLRAEVAAADRERLVDEFVERIERPPSARGAGR
jgi:F-type H+-transporting ATPase subunit b